MEEGDNGRKKGNRYKGPMDKDNGERIVFESGSWVGQGRATRGRMRITVTEQQ